MGMAAGQARLLSITSRMSDNELRAQIINNNKMRLATESSQVSESYVTALNEAQMMFTNYDADNKATYQQLTYNALTAYNPYNNQYLVTNASGNVLLSESDAVKYKNANGDLTKFLSYYGLENTTTYFDELGSHWTASGIPYKTGMYDANGNDIFGYILPANQSKVSDVTQYIRDLYEGNLKDTYSDGTKEYQLHPGYMNAVSSDDYYNYYKLSEIFTQKQDDYLATVAQRMDEKLKSLTSASGDLDALKGWFDAVSETSNMNDVNTKLSHLKGIVTQASGLSTHSTFADSYFNSTIETLTSSSTGDRAITTYDSTEGFLVVDQADPNVLYFYSSNPDAEDSLPEMKIVKESSGLRYYLVQEEANGTDPDGNTTYQTVYKDKGTSNTFDFNPDNVGDSGTSQWTVNGIDFANVKPVDENGNLLSGTYDPSAVKGYIYDDTSWNFQYSEPIGVLDKKEIALNIISSLKSSIYSVWDANNAAFVPANNSAKGWNEYNAYINAGSALSNQIFGHDIGSSNYALLTDIEKCFNGDLSGKFSGHEDKKNAFQKIYDAYILDSLMNTYGEPKYAWIDTSKPENPDSSYNENGQAKAQWYENLFVRIQQSGYQVLQDGLASSPEWIQFAFESGIINMEQLDAKLNWNPLIYSNCSDITEQTNSAAVAKAEAEYNAAMNKIENKDKRYDLELKNIDTEHNSLQTEYESIKSAIDKNIERTFKLYS